jgi:hypothetical protein
MAIVRAASSAGDSGFASSRSSSINPGSNAGRVILGLWTNDSLAEHLTSSTFSGNTCTLGTEETLGSACNAKCSYLIGDSVVPSGVGGFVGNYTDGNHHPGSVVAGYNGVSAISVVAQGHGTTPGTPISLTGTGFNSGDQAVMLMCFFGGAAVTYTDTDGATFLTTAATTFRYIGTELTAAGSSVTMDGTPSSAAQWLAFLFRLQPLSSDNLIAHACL